MCLAAGKPVALSSDAHEPEHIGYGYDAALELLRECRRRRESRVFDGAADEEPLG